MLKIFVLVLMLSGPLYAIEKNVPLPTINEGEFAVFEGTNYKKFKVFESDGLTFSADCKAKKMKCEAAEASAKKIDKIQNPAPRISPASQLCSIVDGKNLIAFNQKKEEYNFCEFEDGSLVNSWSLYYKFFPKTVIK